MAVTEVTLVARPNTSHSSKYCSPPPKLNTAGLLGECCLNLMSFLVSLKINGKLLISCHFLLPSHKVTWRKIGLSRDYDKRRILKRFVFVFDFYSRCPILATLTFT